MTKIIKGARILIKRSDIASEEPTIPTNNDHTSGWLDTDVYKGEMFINLPDEKVWVRMENNLTEFAMIEPSTGKISEDILPTSILGAVIYQGTWDASSGTPPTTTPEKGYYYVVSTSGTTNLDGIDDWRATDWAIYDGSSWGKVDNTVNLTADSVSYSNTGYPSMADVKDALDYLLYVDPNIDTLSVSPSVVEIGSTVNNISINWAVNKTMTSIVLTGPNSYNSGELAPDTSGSISISSAGLTTNSTYTMNVSDGTNTDSRNSTIYFRNRRHWGISTKSSGFDSSDILGLGNSELATNRSKTFTIDGSGQYLIYSYPSAWGDATFVVGGLETTFVRETVSHTNVEGHTENYYVYRSQNTTSGTGISVEVS